MWAVIRRRCLHAEAAHVLTESPSTLGPAYLMHSGAHVGSGLPALGHSMTRARQSAHRPVVQGEDRVSTCWAPCCLFAASRQPNPQAAPNPSGSPLTSVASAARDADACAHNCESLHAALRLVRPGHLQSMGGCAHVAVFVGAGSGPSTLACQLRSWSLCGRSCWDPHQGVGDLLHVGKAAGLHLCGIVHQPQQADVRGIHRSSHAVCEQAQGRQCGRTWQHGRRRGACAKPAAEQAK